MCTLSDERPLKVSIAAAWMHVPTWSPPMCSSSCPPVNFSPWRILWTKLSHRSFSFLGVPVPPWLSPAVLEVFLSILSPREPSTPHRHCPGMPAFPPATSHNRAWTPACVVGTPAGLGWPREHGALLLARHKTPRAVINYRKNKIVNPNIK